MISGTRVKYQKKRTTLFYQNIFLFVTIYCTVVEFHRDGASGYFIMIYLAFFEPYICSIKLISVRNNNTAISFSVVVLDYF